jgi:hypothetical protein
VRRPGLLFWVLAVSCPLLFAFTSHKLYQMARLRGWVGHLRVEHKTVHAFWTQDASNGRTCWVSWTNEDVTASGPHRTNMDCEHREHLKVGDPIEILYLPSEDGPGDTPYLRNGDIYSSDGNFQFDLGLLILELAGCAYFVTRLIRWRKSITRSRATAWPTE